MNNLFTVKSSGFELSVKDIDTQTRRVKVMLSAFDNVDSDGDVIRRGAFAKSIQERGAESLSNRKIQFLRYHDFEHQIGKFLTLEESMDGLVAIGELGRSSKGNDALLDYQDGIIREHSIGFIPVQDKIRVLDNGIVEMNEVMLLEGSAVTFGANELTPTLDVSKGNKVEVLEKINTEFDVITKALKNGQGTDDRLYNLEMRLKVIQAKYNSLINQEPIMITPEVDEPKDQVNKFLIQSILKQS